MGSAQRLKPSAPLLCEERVSLGQLGDTEEEIHLSMSILDMLPGRAGPWCRLKTRTTVHQARVCTLCVGTTDPSSMIRLGVIIKPSLFLPWYHCQHSVFKRPPSFLAQPLRHRPPENSHHDSQHLNSTLEDRRSPPCPRPAAASVLLDLLARPEEPDDDDKHLHSTGRPHGARNTKPRVREKPAEDGAKQTHGRRADPPVALGVIRAEELRVAEEVTVDTSKHDGRQGVVLDGAARDGLAARLEGDERDGHEHVPGDDVLVVLAVAARAEGDDGGGADAEGRLQGEGGDEGRAAFWAEAPVEAAEEEGAYAEEAEGGAGFDPAGALGGCGQAEADVDGVSYGRMLMMMPSSC